MAIRPWKMLSLLIPRYELLFSYYGLLLLPFALM